MRLTANTKNSLRAQTLGSNMRLQPSGVETIQMAYNLIKSMGIHGCGIMFSELDDRVQQGTLNNNGKLSFFSIHKYIYMQLQTKINSSKKTFIRENF